MKMILADRPDPQAIEIALLDAIDLVRTGGRRDLPLVRGLVLNPFAAVPTHVRMARARGAWQDKRPSRAMMAAAQDLAARKAGLR